MSLWLLLLMIIAGAFANRHRGGWIGTGHTQLARFDFAVSLAILYLLGSWDWRGALVSVPLTFLACLIGQGVDMGDDTWKKAEGLAISGIVNISGIVTVAALSGLILHPLALLALPLAAIGKPLAYAVNRYIKLPPITLFKESFASGTTEFGEVLFGAVEGGCIWVACWGVLH